MIDDKAFIARVISHNDHYAFSCLMNKYQSAIRQLLRRLTAGDYALADDLAQETFITLYKKLSSFRGDSALNTWLHKIAYNHFLKSQQKAYIKREQQECDFEIIDDRACDPHKDILVEQLMAKLSIVERTCITLSISAGMSHPEVADISGIPLGTVKSHINRARQKLTLLLSVNPSIKSEGEKND